MKTKIAVFSFTSCEGCQLQILNLEEELVSLLEHIEIVNFREAIDEKRDDYDIAFVEGSITTPSDVEELKEIRKNAKKLIALGACATIGGVNALKNSRSMEYCKDIVYDSKKQDFETMPTRQIKEIVEVDYEIHGCPITKEEFIDITKKLLLGVELRQISYPVCTECKMNGTVCLFHKGQTCMGPITRGGCDAICTSFSDACHACRGFIDNPNLEYFVNLLKEKGLSKKEIENKFSYFNGTKTLEEHLNNNNVLS